MGHRPWPADRPSPPPPPPQRERGMRGCIVDSCCRSSSATRPNRTQRRRSPLRTIDSALFQSARLPEPETHAHEIHACTHESHFASLSVDLGATRRFRNLARINVVYGRFSFFLSSIIFFCSTNVSKSLARSHVRANFLPPFLRRRESLE